MSSSHRATNRHAAAIEDRQTASIAAAATLPESHYQHAFTISRHYRHARHAARVPDTNNKPPDAQKPRHHLSSSAAPTP